MRFVIVTPIHAVMGINLREGYKKSIKLIFQFDAFYTGYKWHLELVVPVLVN
jgi:hypothetical protein